MAGKESGNEKISLLGRADLFSKLEKSELATIARYSGYRSFVKDDVIFEEGSQGVALYLIKKGAVTIRKKGENGGDRDIARFLEGEVFGEMDLLDAAPRSASAIAELPTTLLVFPKPGTLFPDILEKHPDIFARILQKLLGAIAGRIRAIDKLISEKTPWIQELRKLLQRDKLTNLHNRAYVEEELPAILGAHTSTSLLVIKPDNFKTVNDTYGHEAGDGALVRIAEALRSSVKEGDICARYRGDEYCAIMPGGDGKRAEALAARLLKTMKETDISAFTAGTPFTLTASVGFCTFPTEAAEAKALVKTAFDRMLRARESGGDRLCGPESK
jgi:diguanylate cyclase (GGDEF)-like protein